MVYLDLFRIRSHCSVDGLSYLKRFNSIVQTLGPCLFVTTRGLHRLYDMPRKVWVHIELYKGIFDVATWRYLEMNALLEHFLAPLPAQVFQILGLQVDLKVGLVVVEHFQLVIHDYWLKNVLEHGDEWAGGWVQSGVSQRIEMTFGRTIFRGGRRWFFLFLKITLFFADFAAQICGYSGRRGKDFGVIAILRIVESGRFLDLTFGSIAGRKLQKIDLGQEVRLLGGN